MNSPSATRWRATFTKDRRVTVSDRTSIAYTVRGDGNGEGGHLLPIEEADGIVETMADFLQRVDSARLGA